jgi:hypothetical protein
LRTVISKAPAKAGAFFFPACGCGRSERSGVEYIENFFRARRAIRIGGRAMAFSAARKALRDAQESP